MNKRAFFIGALAFAVAALFTHTIARKFLQESMHMKAARLTEAAKQHTPYVADPAAARASHVWNVLTTTGVVFAVVSAVCMAVAVIRHEPGWYLILILLLVFDIGLPMLL